MINWTEVIIGLCSIIITGVIVPFITTKWKIAKSEMSTGDGYLLDRGFRQMGETVACK